MSNQDRYMMRGVSASKEDVHNAIKNVDKGLFPKAFCKIVEDRLTGDHETCSIKEFRYGESDRGASIRIPVTTAKNGYGYLEDRRPGANIDPYVVAARLLVTIADMDESLLTAPSSSELNLVLN